MSIKLFSQRGVNKIKTNPYVKSVSQKSIRYTDEFKRLFIAEYKSGRLPREIFESCGFDIEILGIVRVNKAANRWKSAYVASGLDGLTDTRKGNSGRPLDRELSMEEKYIRLLAQNKLLQAENELLKKLEMEERRLMNTCVAFAISTIRICFSDGANSRFIYLIQ
ncbi:HTH domain-containing protein [Paenibacillus lautus]|uniref:HTH domain-containing protein n=1 Tax=Paenibacillus lautus TaxID=1401 RepID=UPI003D2E9A22